MRTNLVLLVGTMFHLAVPTLAYSANTQQSPDESVKSIAPENIQIKGSIKDSKGEALIGVNVKIKNSSNGTITDFNGEFSLKASMGDVLEISYVGYKPITLTVSPNTSYNIVMKEDTETLEEVVVTALAYIIHSGFISGYQNRYGDNLKPPTNVYHRMTA